MKPLILLIAILTASSAYGAGLDFTVSQPVYSDGCLQSSTPSVKVSGSIDPVYLWASGERALLRLAGQEAVDITLIGAGVGMRHSWDWLSLWAEAGYYIPSTSTRETFIEAAVLDLNQVVGITRWWEYYDYSLKGAVGGSLGADLTYPLSDAWKVGLSTSYRYLRVTEWITAHDGTSLPYWEISRQRDMSAWMVGVGIRYEF